MKHQHFRLRIFALIGLLFIGGPVASACMNGFNWDVYGVSQRKSESQYPVPLGHVVDPQNPKLLEGLAYWREEEVFENLESWTNIGIYYVYNHQYDEAEKQFRKVATQWPDEYVSAANLGTILEINGKDAEALKWIKQSLDIFPRAHHGSEWIHVKILEAKVNPELPFQAEAVLGIDFGDQVMPQAAMDRKGLKLLQKQLFFQLNERVTFISGKDRYIATLMYALGNVTMNVAQYDKAYKIYRIAEAYGCAEPLLKERTKFAKKHRRS